MRVRLLTTLLATCLLAACGDATDSAMAAAVDAPTSFPATVEGPLYFDLAEAEMDMATLTAADDVIALLDTGEEGYASLTVSIPGNVVKDAGLTGEGDKVRLTLSGPSAEYGASIYDASSLQKL